jgi:hypothetical protein
LLFSNILESTEGIVIFSLVTSFFINSFSQALNITSDTFVQARHFIFATAS